MNAIAPGREGSKTPLTQMAGELVRILENRELYPVFQPILSLRDKQIYGYEATETHLRIATEFGPDLAYDLADVEERDRVVGILDERVPRL